MTWETCSKTLDTNVFSAILVGRIVDRMKAAMGVSGGKLAAYGRVIFVLSVSCSLTT